MNVTITPKLLSGKIYAPSSKSDAHRKLILLGLSNGGRVKISGFSRDLEATVNAICALGGSVEKVGDVFEVSPMKYTESAKLNFLESGSTARFFMPIATLLSESCEFFCEGSLKNRPMEPILRELKNGGVAVLGDEFPYFTKGTLKSGKFFIEGDVTSQFVSGLLMALPKASGDSEIILKTPLKSKNYVDLTIRDLRLFGIEIKQTEKGFKIKGNQDYICPENLTVDCDMSSVSYFTLANLLGGNVEITGDLTDIGDGAFYGLTKQDVIDASDYPDLVPSLAIFACAKTSKTTITGVERLKFKESDRVKTTVEMINSLGGRASYRNDKIEIEGFGKLFGGRVNPSRDHRIIMASAIASSICESAVEIIDAENTDKSYPSFWDDFKALGGEFKIEY